MIARTTIACGITDARVDQDLHRARVAQPLERLGCVLDADDRGRQVVDRQGPVGEQADRLVELVDIRERTLDAELLEQDRQRIQPRVRAAADDDHRALRRERREACARAVLAARALQDHIGAEPLDLRAVVAGVERPVDSRRVSVAAALGRRLGEPHARRAEVARQPAAQVADRAAADDQHRAPSELAGLPHRTQRSRRRLHPRRFHTAHAVRHGVQGLRRGHELCGEGAVGLQADGTLARGRHAEVRPPGTAVVADAAGVAVRVDGDALPDAPAGHLARRRPRSSRRARGRGSKPPR